MTDQKTYFKQSLESAPIGAFMLDKKGICIYANPVFLKLVGFRKKDIVGKSYDKIFPKIIPSNTLKTLLKRAEQRLKTGEPIVAAEIEAINKKGDKFPVAYSASGIKDDSGNIIGRVYFLRDITERKKTEQKLLEKNSQLKTLLDNIPDLVFIKNRKSEFVLNSKTHQAALGFSQLKDVVGRTDFDFFTKKEAQKYFSQEQDVMKSEKPMMNFEMQTYHHGKKTKKWFSNSKVPIKDEKGNIIGLVGIAKDITEKKFKEKKIEYLSFHDTLTGLFNRAFFEAEVKRLDSERQLPISIVFGDINGLKLTNDQYGHDKGDLLIKKIAKILQQSFRKEDMLSRWGGDEFVAILPQTDKKDVESIIKRINLRCKKRSTDLIPLSISLGVATKRSMKESIKKSFKDAEELMYKKKIKEKESR